MNFAQHGMPSGIISWVVFAMVIAAVVGIAIIVAREAGIGIPEWVIQILWIVLAVVAGIVAIQFLASFL